MATSNRIQLKCWDSGFQVRLLCVLMTPSPELRLTLAAAAARGMGPGTGPGADSDADSEHSVCQHECHRQAAVRSELTFATIVKVVESSGVS